MELKEFDQMFERYYQLSNPREKDVMDRITDEAQEILERCNEYFALNNCQRERKIIVSVTSIPERLNVVVYPLKCMLIQTEKPDKIILWLDGQKLNDELLPQELVRLKKYGLEICYVEDVGPHTKYFYAMKYYPNDIVITIDDDLLYQRTLVEGLVEAYKKNPMCVCAYCVWQMEFTDNGIPYTTSYYKLVDAEQNNSTDSTFAAMGFGGVLYPPHCLGSQAFEVEKIRKLALKADDIWLKVMEVLNNVQVVKVAGAYPYPHIKNSQTIALKNDNLMGQNDAVMKQVFQHYNMMQYFKNIEKIENHDKLLVLLKWVDVYQNSLKIGDYLWQKGIKTIAIYGMGYLGRLLLNELKNSNVQVQYGIDRRAGNIVTSIPVVKLDEVKEEVDLIIITAPVRYNELRPYLNFDMVSLEDLLVEMRFYADDYGKREAKQK